MEENRIHVGMADWQITKPPVILSSLGLGSCIAIILYSEKLKIGGMSHIMLPDIEQVKNKFNRAKFANAAIYDMLQKMEEMGVDRYSIKAKIAGGAHMFGFVKSTQAVLNIGDRNIEKTKEVLNELRIRLAAEDVGGCYGRSVYFNIETGELLVRTIAHGEKTI